MRGLFESAFSEEDVYHLPRHIKRSQKRSKDPQQKRHLGNWPFEGDVQNFVFAPKSREEYWHTRQGHHSDSVGDESGRHRLSQPAHPSNILFLMTPMNYRSS